MKNGKLTPVEEWFVIFNNLYNFAGKPDGLPERLEGVLRRAELQNTDNAMVAQYIEHITTSGLSSAEIENL